MVHNTIRHLIIKKLGVHELENSGGFLVWNLLNLGRILIFLNDK